MRGRRMARMSLTSIIGFDGVSMKIIFVPPISSRLSLRGRPLTVVVNVVSRNFL